VAGASAAAAVIVFAARPRRLRARSVPGRSQPAGGRGSPRLRRHLAVGAGTLLAIVTAVVLGPVVPFAGCAAGVGFAVTRRRRAQRARHRAIETAMPDAIELMVVCLHAGLTPTQAIGELARLAPPAVRPGFAAVEQRVHRGAGFADSLSELSRHCGRSAVALVPALATAVRDGLPLAPVLDRLSDEANAGRRRAGEAAARRLPVRLSFPLVACTLPSFVLLAIAPAVLGALSTVRGSAP
jgi:Flp pilus assembly protein TadB